MEGIKGGDRPASSSPAQAVPWAAGDPEETAATHWCSTTGPSSEGQALDPARVGRGHGGPPVAAGPAESGDIPSRLRGLWAGGATHSWPGCGQQGRRTGREDPSSCSSGFRGLRRLPAWVWGSQNPCRVSLRTGREQAEPCKNKERGSLGAVEISYTVKGPMKM